MATYESTDEEREHLSALRYFYVDNFRQVLEAFDMGSPVPQLGPPSKAKAELIKKSADLLTNAIYAEGDFFTRMSSIKPDKSQEGNHGD